MGDSAPAGYPAPVPAVVLRSDTARLVARYIAPSVAVFGILPIPFVLAQSAPGDDALEALAVSGAFMAFVALVGVVVCWWFSGNTVNIQPEGVEAFRRGRPAGHYRWSEIEWCGWQDESHFLGAWTSGVIVAPMGAPYSVPGPNNPVVLGSLLLFTRARRHFAVSALREAASAAGVEVR